MGIWWRRDADQGKDSVAAARWQETAQVVDQRFDAIERLPLDQAIDTVLEVAPQHLSRDELARRMSTRRCSGTELA